MKRDDIDRSSQDSEGYSAFDLYDLTLEGTSPDSGGTFAELYTWGANRCALNDSPFPCTLLTFVPRNGALGLGDAGDRAHPEQVIIEKKDNHAEAENLTLASRFAPMFFRQIQMSKFHTGYSPNLWHRDQFTKTHIAVVTSESEGNLRLCGFGSGGR